MNRHSQRDDSDDGDHHPVTTSFPMTQLLGLHPIVAIMVITVDCMLTALDITVVLWPLSCLAAAALSWPCYIMQRQLYGDTRDVAFAKALFVAILTAIPTPIPSFLTGGAGVIGVAGVLLGNGKKDDDVRGRLR